MSALAEIIECYWYFNIETGSAAIQHYHTPLMECLAFNFYSEQEYESEDNKIIKLNKPYYFFGQQTSSRTMSTAERGVHVLGVKFKPLGITKLTGINMRHMANNIIGADDIWNRELESLCDEIQSAPCIELSIEVMEKFLFKKYSQRNQHYRLDTMDHALSLIKDSCGAINIRDLQDKTNTTKKTLERAFVNYLGINPKLYSQITRFNAAKSFIDNNIYDQNLSSIAYDLNYCDGAHFSAEFKRFSNMTPTEYLQMKPLENIPAI